MKKIVVFDLDETLGFFTDLGTIYDGIVNYTGKPMSQKMFDALLELYPKYKRPGIIAILQYLKRQKKRNRCDKVMIYTNNQGPKSWARHIKQYFEHVLDYPLFDQIIAAFKIGGERIEVCRTSHSKTVNDFIKCTKLPKNTQICFLDDQYHPDMISDDVYYIRLEPYVYHYTKHEILEKLENSDIIKSMPNHKDAFLFIKANIDNKTIDTAERDTRHDIYKIVSKKIMYHLQSFFSTGTKHRTLKRYRRRKHKTLKKPKHA